MITSAEQIRAWQGPAVLAYGFRPFFLGGALYTALAMALWIATLSGRVTLPTAFDPISWHAHEFLFGYLAAIIAGFMLTAVPNWTGRLPIVGWPLAVLFLLWLIGRGAILASAHLPALTVAILDLAMPCALAGVVGREIVAGRNWRNLIVLVIFSMMIVGNGLFHWEAASGGYAADSIGLRLGLGAAIMLIALIGGRIVPSFTRNWLVKRGVAELPAPPMQKLDRIALLALLAALIGWMAAPAATATGVGLIIAGMLHGIRLMRWQGHKTAAEPLVLVLHAGYIFVPLGAIGMGLATLWPDILGRAGAQHLWTAGAIGLMTLAVMTRAALGHTGRPLTAGFGTAAIYGLAIVATVVRVYGGIFPEFAPALNALSGIAWIGAFGGFVVLYGPILMMRE